MSFFICALNADLLLETPTCIFAQMNPLEGIALDGVNGYIYASDPLNYR